MRTTRCKVRSATPSSTPYKGEERRAVPRSQAKPQPAAKPFKPATPAPAAAAAKPATPILAAKPVPAGGDDKFDAAIDQCFQGCAGESGYLMVTI